MAEQRIDPHKVTKPIQLLAAWLVGLVLTNSIFLGSAVYLNSGSWERGALVIASIVNVPIFLLALFILQTKFRAELQEDTYYSEYLSKKTASLVRIDKNAIQDTKLEELEKKIDFLAEARPLQQKSTEQGRGNGSLDWSNWPVALNDFHPRFKEIREALRNADIPLSAIFGNMGNSKEPPQKWVISLSYSLPVAHKAQLLKAVLPYGFDGIQFWEPQREADEDEDVYIGSYGIDTYAQVTKELTELLAKKIEDVDLRHYYKRHKTKYEE